MRYVFHYKMRQFYYKMQHLLTIFPLNLFSASKGSHHASIIENLKERKMKRLFKQHYFP